MYLHFIKFIGLALLFGALIAVGMRVVEWLIPKPPVHLLICLQDTNDQLVGNCKTVQEIMDNK